MQTDGRTVIHDEANSRCPEFCNALKYLGNVPESDQVSRKNTGYISLSEIYIAMYIINKSTQPHIRKNLILHNFYLSNRTVT